MDDKKFESYLVERYRYEITWYNKRAAANKTYYYATKIYVIAVSVCIPAVISLAPLWLISILSASVALVEGFTSLGKFHENWMNYRTTCETLKKEEYYYFAGVDEYSDAVDKKALFVMRVERIISRENTLWISATENVETKQTAIRDK